MAALWLLNFHRVRRFRGRWGDEYFKGALKLMSTFSFPCLPLGDVSDRVLLVAKADSPRRQAVLSLFSQPPCPSRGIIYDLEADLLEHAAPNDIVQERLVANFRLHGAVDMGT